MKIQLEEFNDCPGANAMATKLMRHDIQRNWDVADGGPDYLKNGHDTLVLRLREGIPPTLKDGITLGEIAVEMRADEFGLHTDPASDKAYVRFWWD